jgi:hypothetical protein
MCPCGWVIAEKCGVPHSLCELHHRDEICQQSDFMDNYYTYLSPDQLMIVLEILRESVTQGTDYIWRDTCLSNKSNAIWGLLHNAEAWYKGVPESDDYIPTLDLQHMASFGPGGLRLSLLSPASTPSLSEYVKTFDMGGHVADTVNFRHKHTISQPVCEHNLRETLLEDLSGYFKDVFIPMAHTVQFSASVASCSRWILEYALLETLLIIKQNGESPYDLDIHIAQQQVAADKWKDMCINHMFDVGLCTLRGVYNMIPEFAQSTPEHCEFASELEDSVSQCIKFYYTQMCIVYCDGNFYDPCLYGECRSLGTPLVVGPDIFGDTDLHVHETLLTGSLYWPNTIMEEEVETSEDLVQARFELQAFSLTPCETLVDYANLFTAVSSLMPEIITENEETPQNYCGNLIDYWPDTQHPVGYHPTVTCMRNETSVRGFGAWMSQNVDGDTIIDPTRMRNRLKFSGRHI